MTAKVLGICLVLFVISATYVADSIVGHGAVLWIFSVANVVLVTSIWLGRLSWFYAFLVVFFFLGCWFKVIIHHIFDYAYVEPTGNFQGTKEQWIDFYLMIVVLSVSLVFVRVVFYLIESAFVVQRYAISRTAPVKTTEWVALLIVCMVFYLLNNFFAFFVTGVDVRLVLPFGLNAPLAFMALIGVAVVVSSFVARDVNARGRLTIGATLSVLFVSAASSISMASRAAVVMQFVPILLGATYVQTRIGTNRVGIKPYLLFGVVLAVVLVAVTIYRINVFSGSGVSETELFLLLLAESAMLIFDRWIGAEAIMVSISEPSASVGLFVRLLTENPTAGVAAIYQQLAGSKYDFLDGLTFLTLPGYFGVLGLSGSVGIVCFGALLIATIGMVYEKFVRWALFNQAVCVALISAAVANAFTQLSFPRLLVPFFVQLTTLIVILRVFLQGRFVRRSVCAP